MSQNNSSICETVLKDIQSCLLLCTNNKKSCDFNNHTGIVKKSHILSLLECENIQKFGNSLNDVNIKMIIKDPYIEIKKGYCIDYNTSKRILIIGKTERCGYQEQPRRFTQSPYSHDQSKSIHHDA
jgi:hypothetical protein